MGKSTFSRLLGIDQTQKIIGGSEDGINSDGWKDITSNAWKGGYDEDRKSIDEAQKAADLASTNAKNQASLADQEFNKANMKSPSVGAYAKSNADAVGSTLLTGTEKKKDKLLLGKTSLLGG